MTTPLAIAGLGTPELLILLSVLVLLFGAKKLPELARGVGSSIRILREESREELPDVADHAVDPAR